VVAQDSHGNTRTNNYQTIVAPQPSYSPTYDADGNELTNGAGQTYTWDAKSELSSITYTGGASTLFTYDALGRRIGIVEKNSGGTVTSTKQLVWDGTRLAEERNASNTVTKRFYAQGEQISGGNYFNTRDHLGSIREMIDSSGNIQARYDYDPYGRVTKISGSTDSDFQYAGYYEHATSGLNLTMFRAYDPTTARWLSRDPDGEEWGPNLYWYANNDPIRYVDMFGENIYGLTNTNAVGGFGHGAMISGSGDSYVYQSYGSGPSSSGASSGSGSCSNNVTKRTFTSLADALAFAASQGYNAVNEWNTTPAQDQAAQNAMDQETGQSYSLLSNNCQDAVNSALSAAGIDHAATDIPTAAALQNAGTSNSHFGMSR
jgi:RHS repeat-associated protein